MVFYFSDNWLFHVLLPFAAYTALAVSALLASAHERIALFADGAAALLLLFVGIHNAWDAVTYVYLKRGKSVPASAADAANAEKARDS